MRRKRFLTLIIVLLWLVPAGCRSSSSSSRTPDVRPEAAPAAPAVSEVRPEQDFAGPSDTATALPSSIAELNRLAHERGWLQDAFFSYDEAALTDEARAALDASAEWLKRNPEYQLLIEGHADERGTEDYNLALGDRRAHTALDYLGALGIDGGRIRTVSYGEERPFIDGHSEQSLSQNRRAHLAIVQ